MAFVRILIDGYSLLHSWPELARGQVRHSAAAREELIRVMTQYQDAAGTPVTVFFDGSLPKRGMLPAASEGVEVIYSSAGQTADQMIERAAHRYQAYGEVVAVTDDHAERDTVLSLGGFAYTCRNFVQMVESTLAELSDDIKTYNRQERNAYKRRHS